jgi:hypothetical protein
MPDPTTQTTTQRRLTDQMDAGLTIKRRDRKKMAFLFWFPSFVRRGQGDSVIG